MDRRACAAALGIQIINNTNIIAACLLQQQQQQQNQQQNQQQEQQQEKQKKARKAKSCWVREWLSPERRLQYGQYTTLMEELRLEDQTGFENFTRISAQMFDEILQKISPAITKQTTQFRKPLEPGLKLAVTLR